MRTWFRLRAANEATSQFLIPVEIDLAQLSVVPGLEWQTGTKMTTDEEDCTDCTDCTD